MNSNLRQILLNMSDRDELVRMDLLRRGELFSGYHPEMEQVHNENAESFTKILNEFGWPTKDVVGQEAASAAWLIVQHAIGKPVFMRECLSLLKVEMKKGTVEPTWIAMLQDRIDVFEGKPQTYGTQFDWDSEGKMSPLPIQSLDNVDELRRSVGLKTLSEAIDEIRSRTQQERNIPPANLEQRDQEFLNWARKVGWRS